MKPASLLFLVPSPCVVACLLVFAGRPTAIWSADTAAAPSAAERLNEPGPEAAQLATRAGTWEVVATFWPTPGAAPIVSTGLIAERRMVGLYLEEVMRPAPESGVPDFRRLAYLTYSRLEGRWQYVSMDTRLPVGIMPAYSFNKGTAQELKLQFEPLAFVGMGREVEGRMLRSSLVITRDSEDHDVARQYWITADGTERDWLAVQYEYKRRSKP